MDSAQVSITTARGDDAHAALFVRRGGEVSISLARPRSDRRDALHEALRAHAACTIGGARLPLSAPITARAEGEARLSVGGATLAVIDLAALAVIEARPLTPFEVRVLADTGHPGRTIGEEQGAPPALVTDLHTHLAACVEPAELLSIGARAGVRYPPALLELAGIRAGTDAPVALSALDPHLLARLASRLAIPLDRRITFLDLERVYALRAPITKHPAALAPMLGAIGRDYAAMGARYVELSYSAVIKAEALATIHRVLPAIEAETGVTIRFLAALSRHDDLAWDLDLLDRIAELEGSRYLVGVDFMGHETNATRAFEPQLRALAAWASERRPGFVIRVHAGESPAHPANVREVLEICAGAAVELRIGHGVHGVDQRTLDALVERGAIVEINASSNVALNNVITFGELPVARYARAGARLALGTDGYGVYGTTLAHEARTARLAGLDDRAFAAIAEGERALIAARLAQGARAAEPSAYEVPPDRPPHHFTEAVLQHARAKIEERDRALADRLSAIGVTLLDPAALDRRAAGKRVVGVAGSWANHWASLDDAARSAITAALEDLVRGLDPAVHMLVTGGTRHGVEGVVGPLAMARGIEVIAALVAETPPRRSSPEPSPPRRSSASASTTRPHASTTGCGAATRSPCFLRADRSSATRSRSPRTSASITHAWSGPGARARRTGAPIRAAPSPPGARRSTGCSAGARAPSGRSSTPARTPPRTRSCSAGMGPIWRCSWSAATRTRTPRPAGGPCPAASSRAPRRPASPSRPAPRPRARPWPASSARRRASRSIRTPSRAPSRSARTPAAGAIRATPRAPSWSRPPSHCCSIRRPRAGPSRGATTPPTPAGSARTSCPISPSITRGSCSRRSTRSGGAGRSTAPDQPAAGAENRVAAR
ncbi:MAG: hypothetical protein U0359_19575 [Byssovorax sp.]